MATHRVEAPRPQVDRLSAGRFSEGSGYATWRTHGTDDWLIIHTVEGQGRFGLSGPDPDAELLVGNGDVVLISPGTPHDYRTAPGSSVWGFQFAHFHPRADWLPLLDWPQLVPGHGRLRLAGEVQRRVTGSLDRAVGLSRSGLQRAELFGSNALESALLWISTQLPAGRLDPRLITVLELIDARLAEPLDVRRLAAAVGLSDSRLAHLFAAELDTSPREFVEQQRMRLAEQLLQLTARSITEVAGAVGYADPLYFSTRFRLWSGRSPSAYRRQSAGG